MALGWGLWEGPARFYFWAIVKAYRSLVTSNSIDSFTFLRLTFKRVALIYVSISPNDLF